MNLFFLDTDPTRSAQYYLNRHCVKIILELAQMLYAAHWLSDDDGWIQRHTDTLGLAPYRKTHVNHPTTKWARQTRDNYLYMCRMGLALCSEYTRRYGKVHKTQVRLEWLAQNVPCQFDTAPIPAFCASHAIPECTPIPLAMPVEYHCADAIDAYRQYYVHGKAHVLTRNEYHPWFKN